MRTFRYIDDVERWLEPLGYEAFWREIGPYCLPVEPREGCDAQLASGEVDRETMLYSLKVMARMTLTVRHQLEWRPATPWLKVVESH